MTEQEKLEFEACQYADVPCLPPELGTEDDGRIWVNAIAKVITYEMRPIYAIVRNNMLGSPIVVNTFGEGACARIESIHPYSWLEDQYLPSKMKDSELKRYLSVRYDVPLKSLNNVSPEKLIKLALHYGIDAQIRKEKEERALGEHIQERRELRAKLADQKNENEDEAIDIIDL